LNSLSTWNTSSNAGRRFFGVLEPEVVEDEGEAGGEAEELPGAELVRGFNP
tara:strand:- start:166 stop:318 length:153 start_codon:yes stop_codon:yes gene_type:complete